MRSRDHYTPRVTHRSAASETWTTRRLLTWMGQTFAAKGLESPRLMAEMLMAHVLGCERLRLYMDVDRPASPLEREALRDLVARALKHEPVQYLVGEAWFYGLPFHVDPRVLIPRPSTESMVQEVLQHHRARHGAAGQDGRGVMIADVCTGSGCIAVALLKNLPEARAVATDLSTEALEVARRNAARHGVSERVEFLAGDLLTPVLAHAAAGKAGALDFLVSNPPYIPDDEWPHQVGRNVLDHEPHLALRGGADGLDHVRRLLNDGPALVKPGGLVLVEVATSRARAAASLASGAGLGHVRVVRDHEGLDRVIVGERA
ncbi:MAG: release factor glutamine methyltransferase [Phycisphaerae bacterium]|nr:MAG: release factor glutamine methyltransferase [Phycisphaerae bacterium]